MRVNEYFKRDFLNLNMLACAHTYDWYICTYYHDLSSPLREDCVLDKSHMFHLFLSFHNPSSVISSCLIPLHFISYTTCTSYRNISCPFNLFRINLPLFSTVLPSSNLYSTTCLCSLVFLFFSYGNPTWFFLFSCYILQHIFKSYVVVKTQHDIWESEFPEHHDIPN